MVSFTYYHIYNYAHILYCETFKTRVPGTDVQDVGWRYRKKQTTKQINFNLEDGGPTGHTEWWDGDQ